MLLMFGRAKPLRCVHLIFLQVLEADLNLLVLQGGNLLMLYAALPLVLKVPRWMLDFSAHGVNPRNFEHCGVRLRMYDIYCW